MSKTNDWSIFDQVFDATFTDKTYRLLYKDEGESKAHLTLIQIRGPKAGNELLLPVRIVQLRPKLCVVTRQPTRATVVC